MTCRAIPYEGTEPYLFVSYCHADKETLFPLFELLALSGCRIWYDDGNHCGDDWLDNIENHLEECSACLTFISGNASLSHNCKSEIVYALKCNKKIIPVLIDGAELPKGLRMQLSHLHYIKRSDYGSDRQLLQKLQEAEAFLACKGPEGSLPLRGHCEAAQNTAGDTSPEDDFWRDMEQIPLSEDSRTRSGSGPEEAVSGENARNQEQNIQNGNHRQDSAGEAVLLESGTGSTHREEKTDPSSEEKIPIKPEDNRSYDQISEDKDGKAGSGPAGGTKTEKDESDVDITVVVPNSNLTLLFHPAANKCFVLRKPQTKLGRSPIKCDAVIEGNYSVSKYHADIIQVNRKVFLRDANSTNGTYMDHNRMEANSQIELKNPAVFQLNDETLALISGKDARKIWEDRVAVFLMNEDQTAVRFMESDILYLDRNHKWSDGTLSDKKIHRAGHARLQKQHGVVYLVDDAPDYGNSTYLNDHPLTHGEARRLSSGDKIRLGDTVLFLSIIPI